MEKITWRTQRKYFQEFNIIYSNSAIAFEMVWRRVSGSSNFFVCHRQAKSHWPGQRIQQLFNFCFHLYQLHLIGGQFWIDFFLPAVEYLKVFELLLHGRENELLKFFFVDFSATRAVLAFCPFDTAALKINDRCFKWVYQFVCCTTVFFLLENSELRLPIYFESPVPSVLVPLHNKDG